MSNAQSILAYVEQNPGSKAVAIGRALGIDKKLVNSALYGQLKSKLRQDAQYRWWPIQSAPHAAAAPAEVPKRPTTDIGRLCQYYLDCMSQELESGVSTFASSRHSVDYAELPGNPFGSASEVLVGDGVHRIINLFKQKKHQRVLYVGYPTRLRLMKSKKSSWQGFMVEPVLLFPVDVDGESGPALSDDSPMLNFKVLSALNTVGAGRTMEEALRLSEELGLMDPDGTMPDPEELVMRLRNIRPEWDWQEDIDPDALSTEPALAEAEEQGIYNRAVILFADRSPYTRGLEAELAVLQKVDEMALAETQLGQWLSGRKPADEESETETLLEPLPLNSEQRQAVIRGLTQPLTVITGPPGTGKSQVVTSLLINAAFRGKRVLFASKNNKAVDVVEERVNGLGARPVLLRMGANEYRTRLCEYIANLLSATATDEDRAEYEECRSIHEQLVEQFNELDRKKDQILAARNKLDELEQKVESHRELFGEKLFSSFGNYNGASIGPKLHAVTGFMNRADRSRQGLFVQLFWPFMRKRRFEELVTAIDPCADLFVELGMEPPQIVLTDETIGDIRSFVDEALNRQGRAAEVKQYLSALCQIKKLPSLENIAREQTDLTKKMASNSESLWDRWVKLQPVKLNTDQRRALKDYASVLQLMVKADEDNQRVNREILSKQKKLYPQVVKTLSCWAVTSLSARGRIPLEPGFFDILIIDEASQCDIASALPLLYRAKSAVIIGDPNQLKHISSVPVAKDRQLMVKHDLIENHAGWSYSVTSLFDLAGGFTDAGDIVALRDHHRSHSDIISFSNTHFYEGRLRVATRYNHLRLPARDEPVVRWIQIAGEVRRPGSGGAVNRTEAEEVIKVLEDLVLTRGYRGTLGVVSPFRAQANLINELASQNDPLFRALSGSEFLADTVHSFQGDERDIIIFSPVVSSRMSEGGLGFLRGNRNLFNVAITRARAALWTVGDLQAARNSNVDYLAAFAEYTQQIGHQQAAQEAVNADYGPDYPPVRNPERVSDWERFFYKELYKAGIRPIPQYPEENYALDFAVFEGNRKLNVEVDGERYHREWTGELCRRDLIRNQRLIELGWDVKRFWVYEIRDNLGECIVWIHHWLTKESRHE